MELPAADPGCLGWCLSTCRPTTCGPEKHLLITLLMLCRQRDTTKALRRGSALLRLR